MKLQNSSVLLAMATFSSIPFIFSVPSAQAMDFTLSAQFSGGYSAQGSFSTKSGTPASFYEASPGSAPFTTQYLQSLSLSVFDPSNTLLDSGSGVINGVSSDKYLNLQYDDSQSPNLPKIDISTQQSGSTLYYFISNGSTPDNNATSVPYGSTTYNLFSFNKTNFTASFLGSTSSIQATVVPFEIPGGATIPALGSVLALGIMKKVRKFTSKSLSIASTEKVN